MALGSLRPTETTRLPLLVLEERVEQGVPERRSMNVTTSMILSVVMYAVLVEVRQEEAEVPGKLSYKRIC